MGRKRRFCFAVEKKITEREGWKWMEGGWDVAWNRTQFREIEKDW